MARKAEASVSLNNVRLCVTVGMFALALGSPRSRQGARTRDKPGETALRDKAVAPHAERMSARHPVFMTRRNAADGSVAVQRRACR